MKPQYAVEILLTSPVTLGELHRACRTFPLAANADRTRLMTVHSAKSPGRALRSLRHDLDRLLPVDVLATHYPDPRGQVLLNLALSRDVCSTIHRTAADCGRKPADFLGLAVVEAMEQDRNDRARRLAAQLEGLLAHHTAEDVLACAARALLRSRPPTAHTS